MKANRKTVFLFYSNLEKLLKAGIEIRKSLTQAAKNLGKGFEEEIQNIVTSLEKGSDIEMAFNDHGKSFSKLDKQLIGAGDQSGQMVEVLKYLQDWYQFVLAQMSRFREALIKPFFLFHAALFIVPFPALVLSELSSTEYLAEVIKLAAFVYIPFILFLGLHQYSKKNKALRMIFHRIWISFPVLGSALQSLDIGRYCKCFHMLYKAGLPIQKCCLSGESICFNEFNRRSFAQSSKMVEEGKEFSSGLSGSLPSDFLSRIVVAEESGTLEETMALLAEEYIELSRKKIDSFAGLVSGILGGLAMIYVAYQIVSTYVGILDKVGLG